MFTSARLMAVDLVLAGVQMRAISFYAPTNPTALSTKKKFYRDLKKLFVTFGKDQQVLLQGDGNATFSLGSRNSYFDGAIDRVYDDGDTANENGELFLDFCREVNLSIMNSWFIQPDQRRWTWYSNDQRTRKVIDYSCTSTWLRRFATNCRVHTSHHLGKSDHRLLVTGFITAASKLS